MKHPRPVVHILLACAATAVPSVAQANDGITAAGDLLVKALMWGGLGLGVVVAVAVGFVKLFRASMKPPDDS